MELRFLKTAYNTLINIDFIKYISYKKETYSDGSILYPMIIDTFDGEVIYGYSLDEEDCLKFINSVSKNIQPYLSFYTEEEALLRFDENQYLNL